MRLPSLLLTAAAAAALFAGCGGDDATTPSPAATTASGSYPAQGVTFRPPPGWSVTAGKGNLVATVRAGTAMVAVWRFPREQRLPASKAELSAARDALLQASHANDATFREIKSAPATIAGHPAVQVRARQEVAGQVRVIRSSHIYADGAEYVVDASADPDRFRTIDAQVFRPMLRSLQVSRPS
jgi:hypothetical protein